MRAKFRSVFISCAAMVWMSSAALAQPPSSGSTALTNPEYRAINTALKALLVQQDPSLQAIFDKYPNYNPIPLSAARAVIIAPTGGLGAAPKPANQPEARTDQNSQTAHAQLLAKAKVGGIDIYFEGDSITRRWGAADYPEYLANWKQNFFGWNAADFGWGADTIQNILWRLNNGELDGVNPKVIVLLAGTNNVGGTPPMGSNDAKVADVTSGIRAILNVMQAKAPNAVIILTAITPRNDRGTPMVMPTIDKINANLAQFADGKKIRYLNINDKLADQNGKLLEGMMNASDQLHPTLKGYQVWADALKPIFTELLGPPAKTDHAPPPTGDPSAKSPNPAT